MNKIWSDQRGCVKVFAALLQLSLHLARVFDVEVTHYLPIEQLQWLHDLVLLLLERQIGQLKLLHVDHVFNAVSQNLLPLSIIKKVVVQLWLEADLKQDGDFF